MTYTLLYVSKYVYCFYQNYGAGTVTRSHKSQLCRRRKGIFAMSKLQKITEYALGSLLAVFAVNCMMPGQAVLPGFLRGMAPWLFLLLNLYPALPIDRPFPYRLGVCNRGCNLLVIFVVSTLVTVPLAIAGMCGLLPGIAPVYSGNIHFWLLHCLLVFGAEFILFWNGMLRVYLSSQQLGIRLRVIGVICGFIPIANLVVLFWIIGVVSREVAFEGQRVRTVRSRAGEALCATRYPVLMVHGVFFRDFRYFNYWGRIPQALEEEGAKIYYGNHQSAAPVSASGQEIAERILAIVRETGCDKVNIIGHSKGGLDARAALQLPGVAEHVASLTTVNTPHRGCEFADYLLTKIPQKQQQAVADTYNAALRKLGDPAPDFIGAVNNLTASVCREFNKETPDVSGVYYQSVGSRLNRAGGGRFPLNFTHVLCRHFDGPNDGLVGERSFPWGESYRFLTVSGTRGISHGDMIDLNRENVPDFDVREFYVQLVHALKERGF